LQVFVKLPPHKDTEIFEYLKEGILILLKAVDRIYKIYRICFSFLVSCFQPVGLTARREETKKTPSAYGGKKDLIMQCL